MKQFIFDSKATQLSTHSNRESLTKSFSQKVNDITRRLKDLETTKLTLNKESEELHQYFEQCAKEWETLEKQTTSHNLAKWYHETFPPTEETLPLPSKLPNAAPNGKKRRKDHNIDGANSPPFSSTTTKKSGSENSLMNLDLPNDEFFATQDMLLENLIKSHDEQSQMMQEDYLSSMAAYFVQETQLQTELSTYVIRFQELSSGLSTSNSSLLEHQKRVAELESTLTSLENQNVKGKNILNEIKKVLSHERQQCDEINETLAFMREKKLKYRSMGDVFDENIRNLEAEIRSLQ
jgi:DNA repair exonuclease SbcCD ATPase subunit